MEDGQEACPRCRNGAQCLACERVTLEADRHRLVLEAYAPDGGYWISAKQRSSVEKGRKKTGPKRTRWAAARDLDNCLRRLVTIDNEERKQKNMPSRDRLLLLEKARRQVKREMLSVHDCVAYLEGAAPFPARRTAVPGLQESFDQLLGGLGLVMYLGAVEHIVKKQPLEVQRDVAEVYPKPGESGPQPGELAPLPSVAEYRSFIKLVKRARRKAGLPRLCAFVNCTSELPRDDVHAGHCSPECRQATRRAKDRLAPQRTEKSRQKRDAKLKRMYQTREKKKASARTETVGRNRSRQLFEADVEVHSGNDFSQAAFDKKALQEHRAPDRRQADTDIDKGIDDAWRERAMRRSGAIPDERSPRITRCRNRS